jgi:hypothetical protein
MNVDSTTQTTARSESVVYNTEDCIHCGNELFADDNRQNVDGLPESITVVIGGGEHMTAEITNPRNKHRVPRVIIKWFSSDNSGGMMTEQHICPSCAKQIYNFESQGTDE